MVRRVRREERGRDWLSLLMVSSDVAPLTAETGLWRKSTDAGIDQHTNVYKAVPEDDG